MGWLRNAEPAIAGDSPMEKKYTSLREFYPYYLSEHSDPRCRLCHFIGSSTVIVLLATLVWMGKAQWIWLCLLAGYGPAWVGHFVFEKNRPATFQYPLYSFLSDWRMMGDMVVGNLPWTSKLVESDWVRDEA